MSYYEIWAFEEELLLNARTYAKAVVDDKIDPSDVNTAYTLAEKIIKATEFIIEDENENVNSQ